MEVSFLVGCLPCIEVGKPGNNRRTQSFKKTYCESGASFEGSWGAVPQGKKKKRKKIRKKRKKKKKERKKEGNYE